MSDLSFRIIFEGKIKDGEDLEQVKVRLAKLFNKRPGKIDSLFTGEAITIKKKLDYRTAYKYKLAIEQAGGLCRVEGSTGEVPKKTAIQPEPVLVASALPDEPAAPSTEPAACTTEKAHTFTTCPNCGYQFNVSDDAPSLEQQAPPAGSLWRYS
jgi:hypothetical protein